MQKLIINILFCLITFNHLLGNDISGTVTDSETGELLVGTTVYIKELNLGTSTGFDGTYVLKNVPEGSYTLVCSYISYSTSEIQITVSRSKTRQRIDFALLPSDNELSLVTVTAYTDRSTEGNARKTEKEAVSILNIVSAKSIELSPDLNVANVVQRMSGVTLEKDFSGSGQYAILRGMDKRYSYTLINGIKIPSTNNKHRYVSLDLFPSDLVDRIEVHKALTADLEGDAIAGAVNMVMKNAPEYLAIQANASVGHNTFFAENDLLLFNTKDINKQSPFEQNEAGYNAVPVDFPKTHLDPVVSGTPLDYNLGLTIGNRFLNKRLGLMVAGSYSNFYKAKKSLVFDSNTSNDGNDLPILTDMQNRTYTEKQINYGVHSKIDYSLSNKHGLELYAFFMNFSYTQMRETDKLDLNLNYIPEAGTYLSTHSTRLRNNHQNLANILLQGSHELLGKLSAQWSLVYSRAGNETPDQVTISYNTGHTNELPEKQFIDFDGSERLWRHNSDEDLAAYLNFKFTPSLFGAKTIFKAGGLYRQKNRTSFRTTYTLQAISGIKPTDSIYYVEKGVDWNKYSDINWRVYNPRGATANGETYDAYEDVFAGYAMFQFDWRNFQLNGGVRVENTDQGYYMQYPIGQPYPDGNQVYTDILPSIHLKYVLLAKHNFRASYYRATNKPGFLEIVPCPIVEEYYIAQGNPELQRAVADNIDLRWEYFPAALDQIMVGLFYKDISNPIEYAFTRIGSSQNDTYTPINTDKALNKGIEIDLIKYFREFGVKANYTFTQSEITTNKLSRTRDEEGNIVQDFDVPQSRSLYMQSEHVGNLSLLYKGSNNGLNAQVAFSYTGERIYTVSRIIEDDLWQEGFLQLDASAEKNFENGISIFAKAHNLLNSNGKVFLKRVNSSENGSFPYHSTGDSKTLIRDEQTRSSFLIGIRYKFNK